MKSFKQFLMSESINDKGIFKAMFIVGLPGAGKSYTIQRLKGQVAPVVVNTDKPAEFLSHKLKMKISSDTWDEYFRSPAQRITKNMLTNYINGMLPMFIDGTSNDVSNILQRIGILESIGYDVGVIFVHASLETSKKRALEREKMTGRKVDPEFIEQIHRENDENRAFLKSKVSSYKEIMNDTDELTDEELLEAFRKVQGFYTSPVNNIVGQRWIKQLRESNEKYLVPECLSFEELSNKVSGWYR
jgi:dephospho-CoA kinase